MHISELNSIYLLSIFIHFLQKPVALTPSLPQGSKIVKRPVKSVSNNSNSAAAKSAKSAAAQLAAEKREAQRKQLMELKRKNKIAIISAAEPQSDVLIVDSETS